MENQINAKCPFCQKQVELANINKQIIGKGFWKQETMYICPHCQAVLGFSRGKYTS
ncbi:MAG: hypothetical protein WC323_03130 [Patescibacteria group bacterium]|jgi:uncharacterized protein YlaI